MFTQIKDLIQTNMPEAKVSIADLTGTGDHLDILIISEQFKDLALLEQHRLVMDILKEEFKVDLHAVQLKTMTPEKAEKKGII